MHRVGASLRSWARHWAASACATGQSSVLHAMNVVSTVAGDSKRSLPSGSVAAHNGLPHRSDAVSVATGRHDQRDADYQHCVGRDSLGHRFRPDHSRRRGAYHANPVEHHFRLRSAAELAVAVVSVGLGRPRRGCWTSSPSFRVRLHRPGGTGCKSRTMWQPARRRHVSKAI